MTSELLNIILFLKLLLKIWNNIVIKKKFEEFGQNAWSVHCIFTLCLDDCIYSLRDILNMICLLICLDGSHAFYIDYFRFYANLNSRLNTTFTKISYILSIGLISDLRACHCVWKILLSERFFSALGDLWNEALSYIIITQLSSNWYSKIGMRKPFKI